MLTIIIPDGEGGSVKVCHSSVIIGRYQLHLKVQVTPNDVIICWCEKVTQGSVFWFKGQNYSEIGVCKKKISDSPLKGQGMIATIISMCCN